MEPGPSKLSVDVDTPTFELPRNPFARSSRSIELGSVGPGRTADAVMGSCVRSAVSTAVSPDTRYLPPRFFEGSTTDTGKFFAVGAKEKRGLKNKLEALPHSPSTRSTQGAFGAMQTARPDCAVARGTMEEELVNVRR